MNRKKTIIIIVIAIVAIAIPLAVYTVSPLFINTEINEPLPTVSNENNNDAAAIREFNKFMEMGEQERRERGHQMGNEERDMIMIGAAQTTGTTVNEEMTTIGQEASTLYVGEFVGVNDGIHNAEGQVKALRLNDSTNFLRLEDFKATNGPDLYVYLSADKSAFDFVNLGRLKGNIGGPKLRNSRRNRPLKIHHSSNMVSSILSSVWKRRIRASEVFCLINQVI